MSKQFQRLQDDLAGQAVLVTGAAGGVGRAFAKLCGERGAKLVLCDVTSTEQTAAVSHCTRSSRERTKAMIASADAVCVRPPVRPSTRPTTAPSTKLSISTGVHGFGRRLGTVRRAGRTPSRGCQVYRLCTALPQVSRRRDGRGHRDQVACNEGRFENSAYQLATAG